MNDIFSYTNRDYESSRMEGISKIPILSNKTWTDTNSTDPGVIIIDYVHALVDMIQFYQDHNALESFLSTAKERKNIFRLAKQLGYQIMSAKGATVKVTFTTKKTYESSYTIPSGTRVSTKSNDPITYLTTSDTIVSAGQTSVDINCVQGINTGLIYVGTGNSSILSKDAQESEDQYIILENYGIDIDSITIVDNNNEQWKAVEFMTFSDKNDKVFEPVLLYDGKVKINFGNGVKGYLPKSTDTLYISYNYTMGSKGKVGIGELTEVDFVSGIFDKVETYSRIVADDGTIIGDVMAYNWEPSIGGTDPESSTSIRENSPSVIKANDRAVTLQDFEALAKRVPGVLNAKAYDITNAPQNLQVNHYEVYVLVVPDGEVSTVPENLKQDVYNYLYKRSIPPTVINILIPSYTAIDIDVTIVAESTYEESLIRSEAVRILSDYIDTINSTSYNSKIFIPNEVMTTLSRITGVRYVESLSPSNVVELPALSLAALGNTNINVVRRNS